MSTLYAFPGAEKLLKDASTIEKMAISGDAEEEIDSYNATLDADKSMPAELLTLDALSLESNILPSSKKIKQPQ